jgi:DhnA family fructose-bisphosphate aldolase class Ia
MGADIIKADPTTQADDFHEVVEAARCPVLVRGGGKEDIEAVFGKTEQLLRQGAHGMVYGRNIYQHPDPRRVVQALMAMIHEGASAEQALAIYQG